MTRVAADSRFSRWLLPGLLFQSVLIGGGYATGRELVEFFLRYGPRNGLLGILLTTAAFSLVSMLFFELARLTRSYTYMDFFKRLLGRGWFLYEIGYALQGVLVLAVIGAAAGEIARDSLGIGETPGKLILCSAIILLVFFGTTLIERVLAGWSFLLYAVYGVFITLYLLDYGAHLDLSRHEAAILEPDWWVGALQYLGYNAITLPVIVFVAQHFKARRDCLIAGALAGPVAMTPAIFFYLAMASSYSEIIAASVPSDYMIGQLGIGWLAILFYLTIFGTFIETGSAMIHAVNERLAETFEGRGRHFRHWQRAVLAFVLLVVSIYLATRLGLVNLIAQGYGTLTWYFIAIFIIPLLTVGTWKVFRPGKAPIEESAGLRGSGIDRKA